MNKRKKIEEIEKEIILLKDMVMELWRKSHPLDEIKVVEQKGCGESFQPWGESEEESWWKCGDEWNGEKLFCPNCKSKVKKK